MSCFDLAIGEVRGVALLVSALVSAISAAFLYTAGVTDIVPCVGASVVIAMNFLFPGLLVGK